MARTRSRRGKEKAEDVLEDVKELLLPRLFATGRFPSERVNMNSTADFLLRIRDALKGKPEMEELLSSCFGGLFKLSARRMFLRKVVHSIMKRQVLTSEGHNVTLLDYPGKMLLQHAGLTVVDVIKAEHHPSLVVQPMMEISGDHEEKWGVFEEDKDDKKVGYMLIMSLLSCICKVEVQAMMEISGNHEDRWSLWDEES